MSLFLLPFFLILLQLLLLPLPSLVLSLPVSMLFSSSSNFYPLSSLIQNTKGTKEGGSGGEGGAEQLQLHGEPHTMVTAQTPSATKFGALKLCPPGGRSFFEAYEMACPMRRRRKRHAMFGFARPVMRRERGGEGRIAEEERRGMEDEEHHPADEGEDGRMHYRPANITEIMRICCASGCEFADFFPHCGPFSVW